MKYRIVAPILILLCLGAIYLMSHDVSTSSPKPAPQNSSEGIHF